jgi:hypothetical protein
MALFGKALLLFVVTAAASFATSITFLGPFGPGKDSGVIGDPLTFDIQDATITQPTSPSGKWTLTIDTNYGTPLPGGAGEVVPSFTDGGITYSMSDFLIKQGNTYYGIVLHAHDGYAAGDLYSSTGFTNALHFNRQNPVYLNTGGSLAGTGTITAAANLHGDGISIAEYKVTVNFSAPVTFLDSPFTIYASSADCGNSFMTGPGDFTVGTASAPEPRTLLLFGPAMLLLALIRRRARQV